MTEATGNSVDQRYFGDVAATYNQKRAGSERWQTEHAFVRRMLSRFQGASVLDIPVGTGRFVPLYREFGCKYIGADISSDMLAETEREAAAHDYPAEDLFVADAVTGDHLAASVDVAVAVRFFNWLDAESAGKAFANIAATVEQAMIVSLTSLDLNELEEGRRTAMAESLERSHQKTQANGLPPNAAHRWDHFQEWVSAAGLTVTESEVVFTTQNKLVNHIHLLSR